MPVITDFVWTKYDDGVLSVAVAPPTPVGGWSLEFDINKRVGSQLGSGLVYKNAASGYYTVSGIYFGNSGQGQINIPINSVDTSGMDYGNYAYRVRRTDSGFQTTLSEGYMILTP